MAGLGRVQQLFNRAVVGTLAALIGFARGGKEEAKRLAGGHPLLAKYLKNSNPRANTPGTAYPGYGHRPGKGATLLHVSQSTTPDSSALRLHRATVEENASIVRYMSTRQQLRRLARQEAA